MTVFVYVNTERAGLDILKVVGEYCYTKGRMQGQRCSGVRACRNSQALRT
jgi:hypothetical protein